MSKDPNNLAAYSSIVAKEVDGQNYESNVSKLEVVGHIVFSTIPQRKKSIPSTSGYGLSIRNNLYSKLLVS